MSAASREDFLADPSRHSAADILTALATDENRGLSENEARNRLGRFGSNELTSEKAKPAWRKIPRTIQRHPRHPAANCHRDFGGGI